MIILNISEEYGFNSWYAILTDERFEELKSEWRTIKGLNCLVPVRFLIPEAVNLPLLESDQKYADEKYLEENSIKIESVHVHQSDDSYFADLDFEIPEQANFEFKGKEYSEEELNNIFHEYKDADNKECERRFSDQQVFDTIPRAWCVHNGLGPIDQIYDWPLDVPLPEGWVRRHEGLIERKP
jgi:hypothetical protein